MSTRLISRTSGVVDLGMEVVPNQVSTRLGRGLEQVAEELVVCCVDEHILILRTRTVGRQGDGRGEGGGDRVVNDVGMLENDS